MKPGPIKKEIERLILKLGDCRANKSIVIGGARSGLIQTGLWRPENIPNIYNSTIASFAFLYLLRGCGEYRDANGTVPLRPGSIVYRPPGPFHMHYHNSSESWCEFFILLPAALFDAAPQLCPARRTFQLDPSPEILAAIRDTYTGFDPRLPATVNLARLLNLLAFFAARLADSPATESENAIRQAAFALESSLSEKTDFDAIASSCGMDYDRFRKEFKRITGFSPGQYLIRKRLEKAQMLLATGTLTVHQVASHVGYNDNATFFRKFKQLTGVTPKNFRSSIGR